MAKKNRTSITLDTEQLTFLNKRVEDGTFASVAHGVRRCVDAFQDRWGEENGHRKD